MILNFADTLFNFAYAEELYLQTAILTVSKQDGIL